MFCPSDEYTALHWAAFEGHVEACQLLITAKADLAAIDYKYAVTFQFTMCSRFCAALSCCFQFASDFLC